MMMNKENKVSETPFAAASQHMHKLVNICQNWLTTATCQHLEAVNTELGCLRSTRIACLQPVTHELTERSMVQIVVIPASFGNMKQRGYEKSHWQLLLYSWLSHEQTTQLLQLLSSKENMSHCTAFLVRGMACERIK